MTHYSSIGKRLSLLSLVALLASLIWSSHTFANLTLNTEQSNGAAESLVLRDLDPGHSATLDKVTEQVLDAILSGNWTKATELSEQLVDAFPDYALGHLLLAEAHTVTAAAEPLINDLPSFSKKLIDLLLEARARAPKESDVLTAVKMNDNYLPKELIQVGNHIDNIVLVDLSTSILYLFDTTSTMPKLLKKHYISSGEAGFGKLVEGDLKTPLGVYRINNFRNGKSLPALYGSGALTLNYPNALDKLLGKTGYGIWLHGNPPVNRSRSPRSSEGCVTMANDHLLDLHSQIKVSRTHVVLSDDVQWHNEVEMEIQQEQMIELFTQYREAWLANNIDNLTAIYSPKALPSTVRNANAGSPRKVSSNQNNTLLSPTGISLDALAKVDLNDLSILLIPSTENNGNSKYFLMEFELKKSAKSRVSLYWEKNDSGFWQIRREEAISRGI